MLTSPILDKSGISHGFFTRQGGVSDGVYASLNCGPGSLDQPDFVTENRSRTMQSLNLEPDCLRTVYQIHSAEVIVIKDRHAMRETPKADAMVTNITDLALGILTADCVPILFSDPTHRVIGAAHSGWKGALSSIGKNTVDAMVELGASKSNIKAAIGPAISQKSYEVGPEFPDPFLKKDPRAEKYFIPSVNSGHFLFALKEFVRDCLIETGISVHMLENDTFTEEDLFFSYRRMIKKGEADYGRQLSAIALTND
jgi:purine-nucleoside/S-methyl-5'-thioadenosine phosphorylase / adenosine deaminase